MQGSRGLPVFLSTALGEATMLDDDIFTRPLSPSHAAREEHALLSSASEALASRASRRHVQAMAMDDEVSYLREQHADLEGLQFYGVFLPAAAPSSTSRRAGGGSILRVLCIFLLAVCCAQLAVPVCIPRRRATAKAPRSIASSWHRRKSRCAAYSAASETDQRPVEAAAAGPGASPAPGRGGRHGRNLRSVFIIIPVLV